MREANFQETMEVQGLGGFNRFGNEFNFGSEIHRLIITHDPSFTYGHYKVGSGQATVGGVRFGDKLYYAVALCSPVDNFSKSRGRALVHSHLINTDNSNKRGVMVLDATTAELPPAQLLKYALEHYLNKMNHKPNWVKNANVDFRNLQREENWHPPHGAMRRPGSR